MRLPKALERDGSGERLYRGTRSGSRTARYSFWSPDRAYAEGYGESLISATLRDDARILDLRLLCADDATISAEALDGALPGLAAAIGLEDGVCPLADLWERREDLSDVAALLLSGGYMGFRWIEDGVRGHDAYLLCR